MTQRIEPFFSTCHKVLTYLFWKIRLKEKNLFFQFDSKNWIFVQFDSKNWMLFENMTQRMNAFWKYDSKNWTLFLKIWLKELNTLKICLKEFNTFWKNGLEELNPFLNMTPRIEPLWKHNSQKWTMFEKIWLAEFNLSFQHDLTFLFNMTHRNWTHF